MAFTINNWGVISSGAGLSPLQKTLFQYVRTSETIATITASAYFNYLSDNNNPINTHDLIYIVGSNGAGWYRFTSATSDVTVAAI